MFEQSAIGANNGRFTIYHLDERARNSVYWRDYFDRIGSLDRSDLIQSLGDSAEVMAPFIIETEVNGLSMNALLEKWAIERIDGLIVDAEGYDWAILRQTFELGIRPKVIVFEHAHLDSGEREVAAKTLGDYSVDKMDFDYVCVRQS